MAVFIGKLIGALLGIFIVSRLVLWLSRAMGDTVGHIVFAHAVTFGFATFVGGYGFARVGEGPDFIGAASRYALAVAICLGLDLLALRGRRATRTESSN